MKRLLVIVCIGMLQVLPLHAEAKPTLNYTVSVNLDADSFYVTLDVSGLTGDSAVFQFASTAPGTYQVMDVGRFVGSFTAYNAKGEALPVHSSGINQYVIGHAGSLAKIQYRVDDSFGSPIKDHPIYPMGGSNIEKDNALVNGQMVFGFFKNHQSDPVSVRYRYPKDWKIGTVLKEKDGSYYAESYDQLVDSPVLIGRLTTAALKIGGTKIDIYCYSQNGILQADSLAQSLKSMLEAADKFIDGLPVKRYTFLFHFRKDYGFGFGAWEHNYCSEYYMPEQPLHEFTPLLLSFASHEFFHVVTPLNIHSEIIEPFNFETPVASQHLWLYEGTTEWAAQMMQVRGGLMTDRQFLDEMTSKMNINDGYDPSVSLVDLSLGSYGAQTDQYGNIYAKGALTALFLDMRLLELSKGKTGLRDVIKKLSKEYGPKRTFSEKGFFDTFVKMTYPEIGTFFDKYVKGTEPLPVKEYFAKAGYEYFASVKNGVRTSRGTFEIGLDGDKLVVKNVDPTDSVNIELGIKNGDEFLKLVYQGEEAPLKEQEKYQALKAKIKAGDPFAFVVGRDGKELTLNAHVALRDNIEKHKLVAMERITKEQEQFRKWWLSNQ